MLDVLGTVASLSSSLSSACALVLVEVKALLELVGFDLVRATLDVHDAVLALPPSSPSAGVLSGPPCSFSCKLAAGTSVVFVLAWQKERFPSSPIGYRALSL